MAQNDVIEQLLQVYEDYRVAQLNFNADRRAADKTISAVYERIRQEKAENDVGILECQKILGIRPEAMAHEQRRGSGWKFC